MNDSQHGILESLEFSANQNDAQESEEWRDALLSLIENSGPELSLIHI